MAGGGSGIGGSATVAVSNVTAQQVWALITALTGHANDGGACATLTIRGDDGNTGSIYLGDSGVTTSNYAIKLSGGDSRTYNAGTVANTIALTNKWLLASGASQKVDLEWNYA